MKTVYFPPDILIFCRFFLVVIVVLIYLKNIFIFVIKIINEKIIIAQQFFLSDPQAHLATQANIKYTK